MIKLVRGWETSVSEEHRRSLLQSNVPRKGRSGADGWDEPVQCAVKPREQYGHLGHDIPGEVKSTENARGSRGQ